MKMLVLSAVLILAACATGAPVREIETRDVVVTRTERAVTEQEVRETAPPAAIEARPGALAAALDLMTAKMCEWVRYGSLADILLQHAAGMTPVRRVNEPVCQQQPAPSP